MAAFVIEPAAAGDAAGDAIVVASLVPAFATLPNSVGGGGKIETESKYPFGDNATIKISGTTSPTTVKVRVPEWATKATINGKRAPNGTLVAVLCSVACEISVALNPEVKVETGWGSFGTKAGTPVMYTAGGASVPSVTVADWEFAGGATTVQGKPTPCGNGTATPHCRYTYAPGALTAGHDVKPASNMTTSQAQAACDASQICLAYTFSDPEHDPHVCDTSACKIYLKSTVDRNTDPSWQTFVKASPADINTGKPGSVSSGTVGHPIAGGGHYITKVSMSFRYLAGYSPPKGQTKNASTLSINLLDAATGKSVTAAPIYTSPPLGNYSTSYSPLQMVVVDGLKIENSKSVLLQLQFNNNQRNLAVNLDSGKGLDFKIFWSTNKGPDPPSPPSPYLTPPCNGAAITRGPLVFALHPKESKHIVKDYSADLPARPKAVDYEISTNDTWNFALVLPDSSNARVKPPTFDPAPSSAWTSSFPFDDSGEYPFSIKVQARTLAAWGYWKGSKITAVPPASPVKCSGSADCGDITELQLVPFGSTNIRLTVFPWLNASG
jgi:hypothetical protein